MSTIAGNRVIGLVNGTAGQAEFSAPDGVAVDASGNIYVLELENDDIRKISTSGQVTTSAGNGNQGWVDSPYSVAEIESPNSLWRADDQVTSLILGKFHIYPEKGYSKSKALQVAKLDYIHSWALHTSPDYWANLILIGNTDPVCIRSCLHKGILALVLALGSASLAITPGWKRKKKKSTVYKDAGF